MFSDAAGPRLAVGAIVRQPAAWGWLGSPANGRIELPIVAKAAKSKALLTSAGFSFRKNTSGKISYEICRD